jgi:hypothetical protein
MGRHHMACGLDSRVLARLGLAKLSALLRRRRISFLRRSLASRTAPSLIAGARFDGAGCSLVR